ncbi:MAG TPA: ABC transporter permease [Brevundimonas sp.]
MTAGFVTRNARIVVALMMRELITRYGRKGLGFAWVIGEPLIFCLGVLVLWSVARPDYEHGIRMGPFVMTGYMCLLLLRHQITLSLSALQANVGLLHHRGIAVLHLYIARNILEFLGTTAAFVAVYAVLMVLGQVSWPANLLLLYGGWFLLAFMATGLAMIFAALAIRYDVMERIVPLFTYILIPMSGVFFMAAWVPAAYRDAFLLIPLPHVVEMVRAGVFGEFVETHFDPLYALGWAAIFNVTGLLLLGGARERIDAE